MRVAAKTLFIANLLVFSLILVACSGLPAAPGGGGGGGGTGPFTIGGMVTGLTGTGLTLLDNTTESLAITGPGSFAFKTAIAKNGAYLVTISQQPTGQTCTVTNDRGTATANVTNVQVTCSTGTVAIGVTVAGLSGTGLTLQDNLTDPLSIPTSGSYTFKNAVTIGQQYSVTVSQQPASPAQTCTVTNGTGQATSGTAVNVQVTCSLGTISIGGSVSGYSGGTGFVLQNNGTDPLTITKNGTFTFPTLVPVNGAYKVTVSAQPSGPNQTCTVSNGTGTATANVTTVSVLCPPVFHPIDVNVVGVLGLNGAMQLINNGGDNLKTPKNGAYTFATLIAHGSPYDVNIIIAPGTQVEGCIRWGWNGTALTTPVNPIPLIDCGHDDWTWMNGSNAIDQYGKAPVPANPMLPPPPAPGILKLTPAQGFPGTSVTITGQNFGAVQGTSTVSFNGTVASVTSWSATSITVTVPVGATSGNVIVTVGGTASNGVTFNIPVCPPGITDTPGGSQYSSTWTDNSGNLWLLTGLGLSSSTPRPSPQPGQYGELWEYTGTANYDAGGCANFWSEVQASATPIARWGAVTWTDSATGHLMLFGGQDGGLEFLNDLWSFDTNSKTWTFISGGANQPGVYGAPGVPWPGGRWGASARLDASGNLWMFGGLGCDSTVVANPIDHCSNLLLNDLWKYKAGVWTWVSGANVGSQAGVYGTKGTPATGNVPPSRQASVAWIDNTGNFWMFGGFTSGTNGFNDLWKYDPVANQWGWISGSQGAVSTVGSYGLQGIAASSNVPGARWLSAAWSDIHGNLWLFGGQGFDATGTGSLGDLWEYTLDATTDPGNPAKIAVGQWTWIRGPNAVSQPGIYGRAPDFTVWPHVTNNPGTRWAPAYWTTTPAQTSPQLPEQQFWMFGGEGFDATGNPPAGSYSLLNDLWRYVPYP